MAEYSVINGKNVMLDALAIRYNSGSLVMYNGVKPETVETALAGNTLIVTQTFQATAFPVAAAGTITANAITQGLAAISSTPTFYRAFKSDGTTCIEQGTVGQFATGGTCSFSASSMTVVTVPTSGGYLPAVGQIVTAAGVAVGTKILALTSGTANTAGTVYSLSTAPGTIAAEAVSATYGDLALNNIVTTAGSPVQTASYIINI